MAALMGFHGSTWADTRPQARHQFGAELGGTGVFQLVYRLRLVGPVYLDTGAFAAPHGANISGGLLVELESFGRWAVHVGGGAGGAATFGAGMRTDCIQDAPCADASEIAYGYGRFGFDLKLGSARRHSIGFDVGLWRGIHRERAGDTIIKREPLFIPMVGVGYLFSL